MYHLDTIRRWLMDDPPDMANSVPVCVPYIKEIVVPALLREPGMGIFKGPVTRLVNSLDAQRLYNLYEVVVRLLHAGVRALLDL